MKKLLLLGAVPFLVGCSDGGYGFGYNGGAPAINWSNPGTADTYTCEEAGDNAEAYYATGEHPNLSDC